jgi:GNAT superfamily N-acetyltransferase
MPTLPSSPGSLVTGDAGPGGASGRSIRFGIATRTDLPEIVAMLGDDPLGAGRESTDLTSYEAAFAAIDADPNSYLIVGRQDGLVVASLQLSILPTLALRGTTRGQLEGVRVLASKRGEGIGRALCAWAIELARNRGCGLIQLTTNQARTEAIEFYEALGFRNTHFGLKLRLQNQESPS